MYKIMAENVRENKGNNIMWLYLPVNCTYRVVMIILDIANITMHPMQD